MRGVGSRRTSEGYVGGVVCAGIVAALLGAAPATAQLRDVLDDILGRSREIVSVEEVEGDETRAKYRVTYRDVEDPDQVEASVRPLDRSLRSVPGFESAGVGLTAPEGEVEVELSYTGGGVVGVEGIEVRLQRRGRTFARKFAAMRRTWGVPGSGGGGDGSMTEDPSASGPGGIVTLDPEPVGDTPRVGAGGSGSGGSGGSDSGGQSGGVVMPRPRPVPMPLPGVAADKYTYVWADQPAAANYTPNATYTHAGGPVKIRRIGPGRYQVTLGGFSRNDKPHAQVTAYGSGSEKCNSGGFLPSGQTTSLMVYCFTASGQPADSRFTAFVLLPRQAGTGKAYALADKPTASRYAPTQKAGTTVDVSRQSAGIYRVRFAGMAQSGASANAQVSARESRAMDCTLQSLQSDSRRNLVAVVQCFKPSGTRVDSRFEVLALANPQGMGKVGFLATQYDRARSGPYVFNSTNQGGSMTRTGKGTYTIRFPGIGSGGGKGGTVQVTAMGGTNAYCKVVNWNYRAFSASIACFNRAGAKVDSDFFALVVR